MPVIRRRSSWHRDHSCIGRDPSCPRGSRIECPYGPAPEPTSPQVRIRSRQTARGAALPPGHERTQAALTRARAGRYVGLVEISLRASSRGCVAKHQKSLLRSISRGNRLFTVSGFNDVSWMGILTYPRKLGGALSAKVGPLRLRCAVTRLPEALPIEWVPTRGTACARRHPRYRHREDTDAQFPTHHLHGRRSGLRYGRCSCQR
jgi:hypothetical protein